MMLSVGEGFFMASPPFQTPAGQSVLSALIVLSTVGTAILDWFTPLGITVWVLYAVPLLFTFWLPQSKAPVLMAAVSSVLILLMFVSSNPIPTDAIVNRTMGVAMLWMMAFLLIRIKAANRAVEKSEQRARTIMDSALDAVIGTNSEGHITYWNRQAEDLFGWAEPEVRGRLLTETIIPPHLREPRIPSAVAARATGEGPIPNRRTEFTALRRDGGEFSIGLVAVPIQRDHELEFFAFIEDLTDRKRFEQALLADQARFRAIAEASPVAMVITRADDGTILYANTQFARLMGMPPEQANGSRAAEFYDAPTDREALLSRLDAHDFVERHEVMLRKQDGSRFWALLAVRRIEFDGEQVYLTGIHDLTERKRVEEELSRFSITLEQRVHERTEELRRSNAELDQHNRAKSAFVSMVSHELRTPMTSIQGYVENMLAGLTGPLTEKQEHALSRVLHNVVRLSRMTGDLLDLSRLEAGIVPLQWESVSVPALLSEVEETFQRSVPIKMITMQVHTQLDLPEIVADRDKLQQIVTNLVENAIKYSNEGGEIDVRVHVREDDQLQISVKDTGPGIQPDDVEKIFEPFYRGCMGSTTIAGAGIGLTVAKKFVELHGGRIWVDSTPNTGSCFYVTLPLQVAKT
jgi:PAS domain S-box-containing protein